MNRAQQNSGEVRASGERSWATKDSDQCLLQQLALTGESDAMQRLRRQVRVMGPHLRGAIIEAERGLGAEFVAQELHPASGAVGSSPWPVNAASTTVLDQLRSAEGQTGVLLSELSRAAAPVQQHIARLMRASHAGHAATRWWIVTEHPMKSAVSNGNVLPELERALPSVTVRLTPLRERKQDIQELAACVLAKLGRPGALGSDSIEVLETYPWPDNLIEMIRVLRTWLTANPGSTTSLAHLLRSGRRVEVAAGTAASEPETRPVLLQLVIDQHLMRVMRDCGGNKLRAAEMLGISRSTLYRMLDATRGVEHKIRPA